MPGATFMAEPRIIGHLNAATRIYQASADEQLVREASSLDGYRLYLMRAFGFEKGLELALARVDLFDAELHARSKSPMIADDLFALGMTPDEVFALSVCDASNQIETIADALGWLFVSERIAFAHGMVFHQLDATTRKTATTYFDLLLSRHAWFEVMRILDVQTRDPASADRVITSATLAFRAQRAWFATSAPSQRAKSDG